MNNQIGSERNNVHAYQNVLNGEIKKGIALELKLSDFQHSNDKLIQNIDSTSKALKIAKNDLKQASAVKTSIDTTFTEKIIRDTINSNCDFVLDKKLNAETTIDIKSIGDSISIKLKIDNIQYLYIYSKKEYRNYRKNWLSRLFHWDWKKDMVFRYEIKNSNPLIEVTDIRVINIKE